MRKDDLTRKFMIAKGLDNKFIVEVIVYNNELKTLRLDTVRLESVAHMFTKDFMDIVSNYKENEWIKIPTEYIDTNLTDIKPIRIYRVNEEQECIFKVLSSLFSQYTPIILEDEIPENNVYNCILKDKLYYKIYDSSNIVTDIIISKDLTIVEFSNVLPAIVDLSIKHNKIKELCINNTGKRLRSSLIKKAK